MSVPKRQIWDELVGKTADQAVEYIKKQRPDLSVYKVPPNTPVWQNVDFRRVFVYHDIYNQVIYAPHTG